MESLMSDLELNKETTGPNLTGEVTPEIDVSLSGQVIDVPNLSWVDLKPSELQPGWAFKEVFDGNGLLKELYVSNESLGFDPIDLGINAELFANGVRSKSSVHNVSRSSSDSYERLTPSDTPEFEHKFSLKMKLNPGENQRVFGFAVEDETGKFKGGVSIYFKLVLPKLPKEELINYTMKIGLTLNGNILH